LLSSIGAWEGGILVWARYLTALFAVVGAIAQWRVMEGRLNLRGPLSILALMFSLGMWISTSTVHYWALTVRPDLPAAAMVMVALWLVLREHRYDYALAAVFFYFAWAFKQSVVLTLVAVCLWLLFHKRWRPLFILASVFFVLTAATLLLGTTEYRFDVLTAPRLIKSSFSLPVLWRAAYKPVFTSIYWLAAPAILLFAAGARRLDRGVSLATTVFVFALAVGLAGMGTIGGAENYMFEAFIGGSLLFQIAAFSVPTRLVTSLLLIGCVQPALQLAVFPLGRNTFGTVSLATPSQYANAKAVQAELTTLKKPIFTTDQTFSLPWFSSDNRAPALVIDHLFQEGAARTVERGGLLGLLQRGDIPTVILDRGSKYEKYLNPGYTKTGSFLHQGVPYSQDAPYDIYSIGAPTPNQVTPEK
jgi:hypothetical protein